MTIIMLLVLILFFSPLNTDAQGSNYFSVEDTSLIRTLDKYQNLDTKNDITYYRYNKVNDLILALDATPNQYYVYLYNYDPNGNLTRKTTFILVRDKKTWSGNVFFDRKIFDESIKEMIARMKE